MAFQCYVTIIYRTHCEHHFNKRSDLVQESALLAQTQAQELSEAQDQARSGHCWD